MPTCRFERIAMLENLVEISLNDGVSFDESEFQEINEREDEEYEQETYVNTENSTNVYIEQRPFLKEILPEEFHDQVRSDMNLYLLLFSTNFYRNYRDCWGVIMACLYLWRGQECGPESQILEIDNELSRYIDRNYIEFEGYIPYPENLENILRWGRDLNN